MSWKKNKKRLRQTTSYTPKIKATVATFSGGYTVGRFCAKHNVNLNPEQCAEVTMALHNAGYKELGKYAANATRKAACVWPEKLLEKYFQSGGQIEPRPGFHPTETWFIRRNPNSKMQST